MAKTDLTKEMELNIYEATRKIGVFGCLEVTIGYWGKERVDYLTYDTKGIWRCYEIKASVSDFYSKAQHTFVGHYNYYVMPYELYEKVKDDIPSYVGVYIGGSCKKQARKQKLGCDEQILKDSMIRSLFRDAEKVQKSKNPTIIEQKNKRIKYLEGELREYKNRYMDLQNKIREKYGRRWDKE